MDLEGTSWTVTRIGSDPVVDGSEPTIAFEGGRAAGTTGCNRWFSAYRAEDGTLSLGPAGSTMMMCADPRVMEQEQSFLRSLDLIHRFSIDEDSLTLCGSEDTVLMSATPRDMPA